MKCYLCIQNGPSKDPTFVARPALRPFDYAAVESLIQTLEARHRKYKDFSPVQRHFRLTDSQPTSYAPDLIFVSGGS
jgi:hypothetical protein